MRLKGVIKTWNDERGFSFIEPLSGGEDVFIHITAFPSHAGRPQINQRVYFEVEPGPHGKQRARNVEVYGLPPPTPRAREARHTLVMIPIFVSAYVITTLLWETPLWVALVYLIASIVTYCVYADDKSKAQLGQWRTSEGALHMLAFVGGWPGALLAQELLRHKSVKSEFRAVFWATVVLNLIVFALLFTPLGLLVLSKL